MKDVRVTAKAEAIRVWIDGVRLTLSGGHGSKAVAAGDHVISWFARGAPGSGYIVEITAPQEAKLKREGTFDHTMLDAGVDWFKVNPASQK